MLSEGRAEALLAFMGIVFIDTGAWSCIFLQRFKFASMS